MGGIYAGDGVEAARVRHAARRDTAGLILTLPRPDVALRFALRP